MSSEYISKKDVPAVPVCPDCETIMLPVDDNTKYVCTCGIQHDGKRFIVPDDKKPTQKQMNTISYINSVLKLGLRAYTRRQAWTEINRNFDKARSITK